MEYVAQFLAVILLVIGILAMMVSIIIEVTKDIAIIEQIPKDIKVVVLSLTLCIFSYFAYISYGGMDVIWYYLLGTIMASFVVSFIVLYGWSKFIELYRKFRNIPNVDSKLDISTDEVKRDLVVDDQETMDNIIEK